MELVRKLQEDLLKKISSSHAVSPRVTAAYFHYPRHEFVPGNYSVSEAYRDKPLKLYKEGLAQSTISQPSFVLYLLDLLDIQPGNKVFEVGTGSGWNAALMSFLVGPAGKVVSMEIIPSLAKSATEKLRAHRIQNVDVLCGDASHGWDAEAPYDRLIFTASAPYLPEFLKSQCSEGGRILFVHQGRDHDEMWVLQKVQSEFKRLQTIPCYFVSMTGAVSAEPNKSKSRPQRSQ